MQNEFLLQCKYLPPWGLRSLMVEGVAVPKRYSEGRPNSRHRPIAAAYSRFLSVLFSNAGSKVIRVRATRVSLQCPGELGNDSRDRAIR
jgi:hypothetical protein